MFFNGTLNQQNQPIMVGATFNDIANDLQSIGDKININVNISNPKLNIDQIDPWNLNVTLNINLSVTDSSNLSSWNSPLTVIATIPLYYFDDPIYTLNTQGIIAIKINQTTYNPLNNSVLLDHTTKQYYKASPEAPSFINRLEGNLTINNINGIESLVNIQNLQSKGINTEQKSIVDHIYFSSSNPPFCHISGLPSWFNIDNTNLAQYNATCG